MKIDFEKLQKIIEKDKKIVKEIKGLFVEFRNIRQPEEKQLITVQIKSLKTLLKQTSNEIEKTLKRMNFVEQLKPRVEEKVVVKKPEIQKVRSRIRTDIREFELSAIEKITLKRLRKKEKGEKQKKIRRPSLYVKLSNRFFSKISNNLIKEPFFRRLKRDVLKSPLQIHPQSYISLILLTTLLSFFVAFFITAFFLFFNFGVEVPFITKSTKTIGARFIKVVWSLLVIPIGTFFLLYFYPNVERKNEEIKINQELPFAAISMSAISGSMIDPTKIFSILVSTKDYPHIAKQFTKLLNQINLQGYSLVNALRVIGLNSPSEKLSELFNGLATTITSGGDLPNFFETRAKSLLLTYRLEREKESKTAETFMDIYISVVIAAPMILMLLLITMRISGLGIGLSTGMIALVMSLGVAVINFVFLIFLNIRGGATAI
ncbi:hypothetical protein HOC29_02090 [archaeon]|nr:hypothetical protein [archaeon]MBT4531785.1 hypothetical protein [archaeon]